MKYKKKLDKYEYISFDIFETLIRRDVKFPKDIFDLVEISYNKKTNKIIQDFRINRINSEISARKNSKAEEVTLNDIYDELKNYYKSDEIKKLKEEEINIELELCHFNKDIEEIYKYCIENNKKIVITSDMYLEEDIIKKILNNNNIKYNKLYLSSTLNKTKRTGSLYRYVLEDLNINNNQIIHIGDNLKSDIKMSKKLGIDSIKINYKNKLKYYNIDNVLENDRFDYIELNSFINNNLKDNNSYFFNMGYETFGPLLFAYVDWLKENITKKHYDSICFLARDGFIMKKAFEIIEKDIKAKYIYASRRALTVPSLHLCENIEQMIDTMHFSNNITIEALLKKIGLKSSDYEDKMNKYEINLLDKINVNKMEKKYKIFLSEIIDDIKENSKSEYFNLLKYLKDNKINGNVALVDIGWYGNMQEALYNIIKNSDLNITIDGFYTGIVPSSKWQNELNMHGFLFEKNKNEELFWKKKYFNAIFEIMFMANHGSTKRYTEDSVELYEYEYEGTSTEQSIKEIQSGALKFVEDFNVSNLKKYLKISENLSMYNMLEFGNNPSKEDVANFGKIMFYDDDYTKIIEEKSNLYYIFHPKSFLKDFSKSYWKTGFLKYHLKLNIPYLRVVYFIRNKILRKGDLV